MSLIKNNIKDVGVKESSAKDSLKPRAGLSDVLAGEAKDFNPDLKPYLPHELIGGSLPQISGSEDEAVWNAASQACGTEKVHYVYSVADGRVWYLASPSSSLASNPDSWCPLAAALPGNSEYCDRETVYIYEREAVASALRWDPETGRMQLFLGAARTILPRVQSMDANFVAINSDAATIVPWRNRTLRTEKLSRAVVRMLILSGLFINFLTAFILVISLISISFVNRDLVEIKENTDRVALELVESAANVMQSDSIKHMVRIQQLLDEVALSNGYLVRYEVSGKRVEWSAIVPQGLANTAISDTTLRVIESGRARTFAPKVAGAEEGDNVRINGKH